MSDSGAERIDRLVLDTSAYFHFRAGHPEVLDAITRSLLVEVPVVVIGELEAAFEAGSRSRENQAVLREFLAEPFVRTRDITTTTAARYGRIFAALRRAGTPIPTNVMWIAAATVEAGGRLLTFDQDFRHVVGLDATILAIA
jgi:predicted nucleic acid-binding protein